MCHQCLPLIAAGSQCNCKCRSSGCKVFSLGSERSAMNFYLRQQVNLESLLLHHKSARFQSDEMSTYRQHWLTWILFSLFPVSAVSDRQSVFCTCLTFSSWLRPGSVCPAVAWNDQQSLTRCGKSQGACIVRIVIFVDPSAGVLDDERQQTLPMSMDLKDSLSQTYFAVVL